MQALFEAILILAGSVIFAGVGAIATRKALKKYNLTRHHQVAGYFLAVIGVLYSLVLGLLVVNVQGKYDRAMSTAQTEANACSDIWNFSRAMAPSDRHPIRMCLKEYYSVVQSEPWEQIADGLQQEESAASYDRLWDSLLNYQPKTDRESNCYQSCLATMQELSDARASRLSEPKRRVAPIVWIVMVTGGLLVVVFTYLFFIESATVQLVLTTFVTAFICLNLLLVAIFEHPYLELLRVRHQAFSLRPEILGDPPGDEKSRDEQSRDAQKGDEKSGDEKSVPESRNKR